MRESCGFLSFSLGVLVGVAGCSDEPNSPTCGNGIQDPDEACDDGNRDSGDACTATCQIPGTQLECVTLLEGMGSYEDRVNALIPLPDLSFVAGGSKRVDDRGAGWIGRYDDSGAQIWLTWPPPVAEESSAVLDIATDSLDGYWALITRGYEGEELIHLDSSGQIGARILLQDVAQPAGFTVKANRLLTIDHHIWLVGRGGNQGGGTDLWVGRFDIETQVLSTILAEDHVGFLDEAWALARNESEIAIAATVNTGPYMEGDEPLTPHSNVLVIRFDLQGQEIDRNLFGADEPTIATHARSIASDGKDGWIVGGAQHTTGAEIYVQQKAWLAHIDTAEGEARTLTSNQPPLDVAIVEDILTSDREVVAVGRTFAESGHDSWLFGIGLDGAPHWEQKFQASGYEVSSVVVAVWDHASRLRTANNVWDLGETSLLQSCLFAW